MPIDPTTVGALITGAAGIGSTLLGGSISNANTAKQIAFEKWKMGNAHQQEVIDLEKAGLNPVLSAGGSGAVGGSISPQMPDISGIKNAGEAIWQAISAKNLTLSTLADVKVKDAQEKNIDADTIIKSKQKGLIDAETAKKLIETEIAKKENEWYDWKAAAEVGKDIAVGIGGLGLGFGNIKNAFKKPTPPINKTTEKYMSNMYNFYLGGKK